MGQLLVRNRYTRILISLSIAIGMNLTSLPQASHAATLTQALVRLDRLQATTATGFMVTFIPNSTAGVTKIRLDLPSGFVLTSPTVATNALDPGVTPVPGSLSASISGTSFIVSGIGSLNSGTLYGFNGSTVTTPAPGAYQASLTTFDSSNVIIEQTTLAIPILTSDQVGISGNVTDTSQQRRCDFNGDKKINIFDLSILLSDYTKRVGRSDINQDSIVNIFDLSILLKYFGTVIT